MADLITKLEDEEKPEESYDASDPKSVNLARIKSGRRRTQRLRVVKALMENKECRQWIYELLAFCNVGSTPYVPGDPFGTHILIGQQNVGNRILADINDAAPDLYMTMIGEGKRASRMKDPTS